MLWKEDRHKKNVQEENCPIAMAKKNQLYGLKIMLQVINPNL